LTPAEPQPEQQTPDDLATSQISDVQGKWVLTREAFDKLLIQFSADRDEAGKQYEIMRRKLGRFFEWRCCSAAAELVDETINRVARRIDEGENIINLNGYFFSVARLIFMESLRERERIPAGLDSIPETPAEVPVEDDQKELRLQCLDTCLDGLPIESRTLILKYYFYERRAKIDLRKQLADGLGIHMNALRIRAYRLRVSLERCVRDCLGQAA
jgi:DNA-directed RNA polymerase specialized sigma24 family protein